MVSPIEFNKVADDGIIDDVEGKNLTIESFLFQDDEEDGKIQKIQHRLIKLGGMDRDIKRNSCQVVGVFTVKFHSPSQIADPSITASC